VKFLSVQIDGVFLLILLAVGAGAYGWFKREAIGKALNKINPASDENIAFVAVSENSIRGGQGGYSYDDHFFAIGSLLNPFAGETNKQYAKKVWGLSQ